jgi:hypothetical protein
MLYQLKIKLRGFTDPPVWRRILMPGQFTFSTFHLVIQEAFGWRNVHLFMFGYKPYSRDLYISVPNDYDREPPTYDARKLTVEDYYYDGDLKKKLCYVYDFGDDWIHEIKLEKMIPEERLFASCIAGKGECPGEDSGMSWDDEYDDEEESSDKSTKFDLTEINKKVQKIRNK